MPREMDAAQEDAELAALLVECLDVMAKAEPGPELTGRQQADVWAAEARAHWQAGRLAEAAMWNHGCRQVDPDRVDLWQGRAVRLLEAASRQSLAVQNQVRLAVAGIDRDDPGVRQITANNESARVQAPAWAQADREAAQ
jgi:hypothetical protein